jgi:hypothetical protein
MILFVLYCAADLQAVWMNSTVAENDFSLVVVQPDNSPIFTSHQIGKEVLVRISARLLMDDHHTVNQTLFFSPDCFATEISRPITRTLKANSGLCSRSQFLKGCRKYSATLHPMFTDGSELDVSQNFVTFPGKHQQDDESNIK